jgi:hypothetical protein
MLAMPASEARPKKKAQPDRRMTIVRTPNKPKYTQRVDAEAYEAMRKTMLKLLPVRAPGLTQAEMWAAFAKAVPKSLFATRGKVGWWMKTVQLDLEVQKVVVREQTKPLRWHRAR